jgi:hypothetical protein
MSVMKPINAAELGCSPTSSNCVIWQGPDINCLNICHGDTVSDIVYQLGCIVCDLKEQLDPTLYDLSCLDIPTCDAPTTFIDFINIIISRICNIETGETVVDSGSEALITIASCFTATLGATNTIANYIYEIGNKVCEQEATIANLELAIQQLTARVDTLETYHP